MISTDFHFVQFLKQHLAGMDEAEIILRVTQERRAAEETTIKRRDKTTLPKLQEYRSDLGDFLHFIYHDSNSGMSWPEAYLASDEWRNKQRARNLEF
jgi:hypothetical protein